MTLCIYCILLFILGVDYTDPETYDSGSTDMGNVSHIVPAIHPFFAIPTKSYNHTKEFADVSGLPEAQESTLTAAKALAMTCLNLMRNREILELVKEQFKEDIMKDMEN